MIAVSKIETDCRPCEKSSVVGRREKKAGLLVTIFLILLPKCPFCLMAYTSTAILCGKGGSAAMVTHQSAATILVTSFFCLAVLLSVILNYRDARTRYAILLVLAGSACILYSVIKGGGLPLYYSGVFLVFLGAWLNASLLYVVSKLRRRHLKTG